MGKDIHTSGHKGACQAVCPVIDVGSAPRCRELLVGVGGGFLQEVRRTVTIPVASFLDVSASNAVREQAWPLDLVLQGVCVGGGGGVCVCVYACVCVRTRVCLGERQFEEHPGSLGQRGPRTGAGMKLGSDDRAGQPDDQGGAAPRPQLGVAALPGGICADTAASLWTVDACELS